MPATTKRTSPPSSPTHDAERSRKKSKAAGNTSKATDNSYNEGSKNETISDGASGSGSGRDAHVEDMGSEDMSEGEVTFDAISLKLKCKALGDVQECFLDVYGEIVGHKHGIEPKRVGPVGCKILLSSKAIEAGIDPIDIMDASSRSLLDAARKFEGVDSIYGKNDEKDRGKVFHTALFIDGTDPDDEFRDKGIGLRVVHAMIGCLEAFPGSKGRDFETFLPCPKGEPDEDSRSLHKDKALVLIRSRTRAAFPGLKGRHFEISHPCPRVEPDEEGWSLQEHKALVLIKSAEEADLVDPWIDMPDYIRVKDKLKSHWRKKGFLYLDQTLESGTLWALERGVPRGKMEGLVL